MGVSSSGRTLGRPRESAATSQAGRRRASSCRQFQLLLVAHSPAERRLHRIPAISHGARCVLRPIVVLRDVGAVHTGEWPAQPAALHATQHMDGRCAGEGADELVPRLVHTALPRLAEHYGILGCAAHADAVPAAIHEPAEAIDGFIEVPHWRRLPLSVRPLSEQCILLLARCVDDIGRDGPCAWAVEPRISPGIIGRPVGGEALLPLAVSAVVQHHGLADGVALAYLLWAHMAHGEAAASEGIERVQRRDGRAVIMHHRTLIVSCGAGLLSAAPGTISPAWSALPSLIMSTASRM